MSRPLIIEYPDAWSHVMNRGRRNEAIFEDKNDHSAFIKLLQDALNSVLPIVAPNKRHRLGYNPLLCLMQGLWFNILQWLVKCWTEPAVFDRKYLSGAYGDCIELRRSPLRKETVNTNMVGLVFRGSDVGLLGIFFIKTPRLNSCDSRKLDLDKRLPLCPNSTFLAMTPTQRESLR